PRISDSLNQACDRRRGTRPGAGDRLVPGRKTQIGYRVFFRHPHGHPAPGSSDDRGNHKIRTSAKENGPGTFAHQQDVWDGQGSRSGFPRSMGSILMGTASRAALSSSSRLMPAPLVGVLVTEVTFLSPNTVV